MADAPVNFLFQILNNFLTQEASLLGGVHDKLEEIKMDLDSMRAFLRDADRRKDGEEGLRTWVGQVRAGAYNVEDIIDEFTFYKNRTRRSGCTYYILETIHLPKMIFHRHVLAARLEHVKSQIASISQRRNQYQLSRIDDGSASHDATERWQHRDGTSIFMDTREIVGLEEKINESVEWLTGDDPRRTVFAVVGMGGLGKTTLVAQAYRKEKVRGHFHCFVWISVSQSYRVEELLKGVIKDLFRASKVEPPSDLQSTSYIQLLQTLTEYLCQKRYLIVIDDVWSLEAWRKLNAAFPQNSLGSRIMLTTRHEDVAFGLGDGSHSYPLEPLREEEAWDLFYKNAFWKEPCPKELEPLAQSILRKCRGLPLAIVALGRILSLREKTVPEWDKVHNNLRGQLSKSHEPESVKNILLLSFYDLPYYLKHCFLYCCVFPEDYTIGYKRIIRLWVAEGFVEEDEDGNTTEVTAEDYLKELVHRNMLQVITRNSSGRFKRFRVHDIVREVALSVSKEEQFCMIYNGQQASRGENFRRMSIHTIGLLTQLPMSISHIRSLLAFDKSVPFSSSFLSKMASSFRLMRVLDLKGVPIQWLPDEVTKLFNLRYLSLKGTGVRKLPKSLGKLQNMQTLDLRKTKVERLPTGIGKLRKLRHLYCYRGSELKGYISSIKVPQEVCQATSLQSLKVIEAEGEIPSQIGNLTQLRHLYIAKVRAVDGADLCASICKMKLLVKLSIAAISDEEALELEALLLNPPPLLQELLLQGHLEKVPQWLGSSTNLTKLTLFDSRLREEDGHGLLLMLQMLRNLAFLSLSRAYEGQQLWFQDGWFPKLKKLHLRDFTRLSRMVIEEGAMQSLQDLWLYNCRELKTLPQGIEHLGHLQELTLSEMPLEFVDKLRPGDGNNERQKVAHIPLIEHYWKMENGQKGYERLS